MKTSPFLSLRGITKSFRSVRANDRIDLDLFRGEVHALLGENGAGKSTLMKVLYGFYRADSGEIRLEGRPVQIRSPHDARELRIGMVFQDFVQVPAMTVAENVALFLPHLPFFLSRAGIDGRIEEISRRYGLDVDPRRLVGQLSVGERQKVEILKLLLADAQILILDEPTRSLAPHEIDGLFRVFDNLRRDGYAVVFITHKMKEVLACADRITVIPGFFHLVHVGNTGAAWGLFRDRSIWLALLAVITLVAIYLFRRHLELSRPMVQTSFGLLCGGIVGNLVDRLVHGHVIDFLLFTFGSFDWPAFNLADTAICIGVGLYLLQTFREPGTPTVI